MPSIRGGTMVAVGLGRRWFLVSTEMLTKRSEHPPQPLVRAAPGVREKSYRAEDRRVERNEARVYLTWRDLAGAAVAALVVLAYVANVQDWWYLGSNRWAAVTMLAIGAVGCRLGTRLIGEDLTSLPIVLLGLLGVAALTLAVLAIVTAAQWALLAFAILVVALWGGATLRHAATPAPRLSREAG
jgi:hypothetical protein